MGTLVAWHYPTTVVAYLADHTYVACGNGGRAWGCWGGKTGGTPLRQGNGSTLRADAIAEPNERANITCYGVNGVCHQAANRILFPAGITVHGAKGYWVSEAVYGTYGWPRGLLGFCRAPFYQHPGVTGDLPECLRAPAAEVREEEALEPGLPEPPGIADYLSEVASVYAALGPLVGPRALDMEDATAFQMRLFGLLTDFKLGPEFRATSEGMALITTRLWMAEERYQLEDAFFRGEMNVLEFVETSNELTVEFQRRTAKILRPDDYLSLLGVTPEEPVVLMDPRVAVAAYGAR